MAWRQIRIARFGGPEVLELAEEPTIPEPGPGEVRIKVLAAGTGFTDSFIRRGRYPDFKGPLPFTPGYELVGVVDKAGAGRDCAARGPDGCRSLRRRRLCAVRHPARAFSRACSGWRRSGGGGVHPARLPHRLPDAHPLPTLCLRARQSSSSAPPARSARRCSIWRVILASRRSAPARPPTCRRRALRRDGHRLSRRRFRRCGAQLTASTPGGAGVDAAFDAIGGAHFDRSFACLAPGGLLVGYGSQTMAIGRESMVSAGLGLAPAETLGRIELPIQRPPRAFLQHHRAAERRIRTSSRPTWRPCSICCATAPFIPSSSIACRSRPHARSMPASTPAGSAARSCCCPGRRSKAIVTLPGARLRHQSSCVGAICFFSQRKCEGRAWCRARSYHYAFFHILLASPRAAFLEIR